MGEEFVWMWGDQKPEAASDGQLGSILRAYREWLLCGDREWLRSLWAEIKRAMDYASVHWDTDQDFVLDGKQHNTYDIEFYGPNPLSGHLLSGGAARGRGNGDWCWANPSRRALSSSLRARQRQRSTNCCGTANTSSSASTTWTPTSTSMGWAACRIN